MSIRAVEKKQAMEYAPKAKTMRFALPFGKGVGW
jgi:hypothetical protein